MRSTRLKLEEDSKCYIQTFRCVAFGIGLDDWACKSQLCGAIFHLDHLFLRPLSLCRISCTYRVHGDILTQMYIGPNVKCCFCPILIKLEYGRQILVKVPNKNLNGIPAQLKPSSSMRMDYRAGGGRRQT